MRRYGAHPSAQFAARPVGPSVAGWTAALLAACSLAACAAPAAVPAVPEASRTYVAGLPEPGSASADELSLSAGDASDMTASSGFVSSGNGAAPVDPLESAQATGGSAANGVIPATATAPAAPSGTFTLALAGDVNFSERTADLLAANPATALQEAAGQLSAADVTMVNLETAITEGGTPAPKEFHFRAPATALDALATGGVDVATMANNHAVDYGDQGLADTLDAIDASPIPVLGIGRDADAAYAPWTATVNGVTVAIFAASQVPDWTLAAHTATDAEPGIASALSPRLVDAVRAAAAQADVVVVYLHWGIEYQTCPSGEQRRLADQLAEAGAAAIVGTHAHLLQGAGWRDDGAYVAYGLGNYYWWRSFGNAQDDNGVLTLTFDRGGVISADFLATRLDGRGVPQVAAGAQKERIDAEWEADRQCADLAAQPPAG